MADYVSTLKRELERAEKNAVEVPSHWTEQEIEAHIASITEEMLGPMGNAERIMAAADRRELRVRLDAIWASKEPKQ